MKVSRLDANYGKAEVARLTAGEWFGEANLFVRRPSAAEVYADGEVVIWGTPADTLRNLFFQEPEGTQLLYNIATGFAQRLTAK